MELEWNHVYHPAPFPLTDIQAVFTEGITCILGDDLEGKQLLFQFTTAVRAPMQGQVRFLGYDTAMLGNAYTDHISYAGQYPFYPPEITLYQYLIHTSLDAAPLRPRSHLQVRRASVGIRLPGASLRSHRRASPVCPQAHPASADALLEKPRF